MNPLGTIYKNVGELLESGQVEKAREYLISELPNMPQDLQNELLMELFIDSLQSEVRTREIIARIQERGVTAVEALLDARDELKASQK